MNLATELIGILITVCYVDWILRQHEKRQWLRTDIRIANRLRVLLNGIISGLRTGLGFGIDILNDVYEMDEYAMHKDVMRVGEHIITPAALTRVNALDKKGWDQLARQIQTSQNSVQSFLNVFHSRLTPAQISDILDLQESLAKSLGGYSIFPDIMGATKDKLPNTKTPPEILQKSFCELTAKELQKICALSMKLSESTDRNNA